MNKPRGMDLIGVGKQECGWQGSSENTLWSLIHGAD